MLLDLDSILIDSVNNISPNTQIPPKRKYNLYNRKRRTVKEFVHQIFLRVENIQEIFKQDVNTIISPI
jgi:hypothetical protein